MAVHRADRQYHAARHVSGHRGQSSAALRFDRYGHYLYDLIYNPAETAFLREGRIRGAWVKSGLEMLVLQAERSWEIWNEQENGNTSVSRI
ncbi:Shikimate dehydrogenase [Rikenella microfusus]|uniref:Shikimate dehydrogenase n=2 Tax=Rikenella microfusus TaxID=28139 RepID=A0A379MQB4_9BACT|nr:Shikimate dehydrogenase [Rikenella microfusus]